ncbi:MAG: hypothetical protein ACP5T3_00265, partial [Candidatus Micrarchaeia archaeon]
MQYAYALADYIIAVALVAYAAYAGRRRFFAWLFVAMLAGFALATIEHVSAPLLISGVAIIAAFTDTIYSKYNFAMLPFAIFYVLSIVQEPLLAAQALMLGMLASSYKFSKRREGRKNKEKEISRDYTQIFIGAIVLFLLYTIGVSHAIVLFALAILLLGTIGTYVAISPDSGVAKAISALERENVALGSGAFWLALGAMLILSFISEEAYVAALFMALFFGDSAATIIGIKFGRHGLAYNRNKSVEGALAYFVCVAALAYAFVGVYALAIAALGALVESADIRIDDNISTSLFLVA